MFGKEISKEYWKNNRIRTTLYFMLTDICLVAYDQKLNSNLHDILKCVWY